MYRLSMRAGALWASFGRVFAIFVGLRVFLNRRVVQNFVPALRALPFAVAAFFMMAHSVVAGTITGDGRLPGSFDRFDIEFGGGSLSSINCEIGYELTGGNTVNSDRWRNSSPFIDLTFRTSGTFMILHWIAGSRRPTGTFLLSRITNSSGVAAASIDVTISSGDYHRLAFSSGTDRNACMPAPSASAGADQNHNVSAGVTLNSSNSSDADGDIVSRTWSQTAGAAVVLSSNSAVSPTFTAPATAQVLTFQVAVTDDLGRTDTDTVDINVGTPEMNVIGGGASASILDGDTTPNTGDNTGFGSNGITGGYRQHSFTIQNTGTALLTLGANAVTLGGAHSGDFSIVAQPATTIAAGATSFISIGFNPSVAGLRTATISIANDDPNENPYDFAIEGTGTGLVAGAPSVAIQNAPTSHDRSMQFNVTFEFSEDVTGFLVGDITVSNGAASNFIAVDGNTYTADITPTGPRDITLDVAASVAIDIGSNGNTAATQVTVKSTIVEETQTVIADFMSNRARHILSNQPDMIGFITGSNNGGGGPLGFLQLDSDLETQTTMSFYTSRSKILDARNGANIAQEQTPVSLASAERFGFIDDKVVVDSDQLQATQTDEEQLAAQNYQGNDRSGTWDVWTQLHGAQSTQSTIKSKFWTANFGGHYFVNNDMLIGLLTEFDWASETNTTANSKVSGNGYMIGPYIAGKVKDQALFYEARALWGQSLNDVSPIGTYTDEFETERWLASLKVQGSYDLDDRTVVKPTVSVSYFNEVQKSYTDSLSNTIPEQTISLGEFKFGPTLTRSFDVGGGFTMQTSVGISGIVSFGVNNANTSTSNAFANEDARARIDAGLELKNEYGVRFIAAGYYDGIGVSDYQSYGGKLGLVIPFN